MWDGDPDCPHRWGEVATVSRRGAVAGPTAQVGNTVDRVCPPVIAQGARCLDCGAWLGEYGSEPDPAAFIRHTVVIARAIRRVLHATGSLWLNIGDSHGPDGDLLGIPGRIAEALQDDGWHRRSDIAWLKRSPMPESVQSVRWERHRIKTAPQGTVGDVKYATLGHRAGNLRDETAEYAATRAEWADCPGCALCNPHDGLVLRWGHGRPTRATEMIYLFGNTERHYYDIEAVRVPATMKPQRRLTPHAVSTTGPFQQNGAYPVRDEPAADGNPSGRNLWNWWEFSYDPDDAWFLTPEQQSDEFCAACSTLFDAKSKRRITTVTQDDGTEKRVCPVCGETERWVGHYAAFPSELPRRCIKAGTSERGVCPECLEPWARIVEKQRPDLSEFAHRKTSKNDPGMMRSDGAYAAGLMSGQEWNERSSTTTLGWRPTCACRNEQGQPFDAVPATVLDPFSGSGTTPREADRLGRSAIGIELNPDYVAFQKARLERDAGLFAGVTVTEVAPAAEPPPLPAHTQLSLLAGEETAA